MLRFIVIVMAAATVMVIIAAVFFCGPTEVEKVDGRAMDFFRAGKRDEAIAVWREGLAKFPDAPQLHYGLGTVLAVRKEFPEATEHLERAVSLSPAEPKFRKELALCLLQQKRDAEAERELRAVLAAADWFPEAHYFLGTLYERRGERDRALQEYVKELNVNPCCTFAWAKVQAWDKTRPDGIGTK